MAKKNTPAAVSAEDSPLSVASHATDAAQRSADAAKLAAEAEAAADQAAADAQKAAAAGTCLLWIYVLLAVLTEYYPYRGGGGHRTRGGAGGVGRRLRCDAGGLEGPGRDRGGDQGEGGGG
jgi:membrane protein involved in colicin uptake